MNFEQILLNKDFCMMFGLVVIEGMTPSKHLSNINEIEDCQILWITEGYREASQKFKM